MIRSCSAAKQGRICGDIINYFEEKNVVNDLPNVGTALLEELGSSLSLLSSPLPFKHITGNTIFGAT